MPAFHVKPLPADVIAQERDARRLMLIALGAALVFHGGLLPFTHGNTYDAFIHMFFGDHYYRSWFDPWEPRWYTGFATTSYPPGTHMAMGLLRNIMPLRAAFVTVQLGGLMLLILGTYRFSLLWVQPRAAAYAAIFVVLASSISETIHLFGQLPTICSLGIFLNGLPYFYRWIVFGRLQNLACAVIFSAATTAAHHVTTIFGGVLFVLPLAFQCLRAFSEINDLRDKRPLWRKYLRFGAPLGRGMLLGVLMIMAVAITVFPYWYWSITDPITQVPIPHGSRENFLERTDLGLVFFVLPWGFAILFLPYVLYKTLTSRLWPLGMSLFLCFILGTGGTTPISRAILHGAFDILTLDRFTFWASILILPFLGNMANSLLHGRSRLAVQKALFNGAHRLIAIVIFACMLGLSVFIAILPTFKPTQPRFIDPAPIVKFLESDEHDRWRYLTLGFGDQFAYMSAQTTAQSVDGNYHSARRLPDLTSFSVERLENAKYLGVPGLGSLEQFIVNADRYHLKYIFANDAFYDPLLQFNGWNRLNRLPNNIVVWEKPDVTPLPLYQPRRDMPLTHMIMWGSFPPTALFLAGLVLISGALRRSAGFHRYEFRPLVEDGGTFSSPAWVRRIVLGLAGLVVVTGLGIGGKILLETRRVTPPNMVVEQYFNHLDFRRFEDAYTQLDPATRPEFEDVLFNWRWVGGLIASYGKLTDIQITELRRTDQIIDYRVDLTFLTGLMSVDQSRTMRVIRRGRHWVIAPVNLQQVQTPVRLQRDGTIAWNAVGRRQPRPDTDLHRDRLDRPRIAIDGARLVERDGRFYMVGQVTNTDADPAAISIFGRVYGQDQLLTQKAMGNTGGHRLLPAETAGFRVEFDGVLSLQDGIENGAFDPTLYIPPEFSVAPDQAQVEGRALVGVANLYRGVGLNGISVRPDGDDLILTATAVNTGTQTATISRVNALMYDQTGKPLWAEAGFTQINIYPGQSSDFTMRIPQAAGIKVITDVAPETISINGSAMQTDLALPTADHGTIQLNGLGGYAAMRLHISTMTHEPLF